MIIIYYLKNKMLKVFLKKKQNFINEKRLEISVYNALKRKLIFCLNGILQIKIIFLEF